MDDRIERIEKEIQECRDNISRLENKLHKKPMKQVFIKFLGEHGAKKKFFDNWIERPIGAPVLNIISPEFYISKAFWWGESGTQDFLYWNNLNSEWQEVYRNEINRRKN